METPVADSETEYVLVGKITTDQEIPLEGATVSLMPGETRSILSDARPVAQSAIVPVPVLNVFYKPIKPFCDSQCIMTGL